MVAVGAPSAVPSDSIAPHSGTELLEHTAQGCALLLQPGGAAGGTQVGMEQGDEMARLPTPPAAPLHCRGCFIPGKQ